MSIKLADIAEHAQVSVSLVSRVLNEDVTLRIKPDTRARILRQWEKLQGPADPQGEDGQAGLRLRRTRRQTRRLTRNILFPLPQILDPGMRSAVDLGSYMNSQFLRHFQRRLQQDRLRLSIRYFAPEDLLEVIEDLLLSRGRYWDGVMLTPDLLHERLVQGLLEQQIPHLFRGADRHGAALHCVTYDQVAVFDPVLDHLETLGHRRIGFVGLAAIERYEHGLKPALARRNRLPRPRWCCLLDDARTYSGLWGAYTPEGIQVARKLLMDWVAAWKAASPASRPTAIVCSNDLLAFGLIEAIQAQGLKPGRDLSIVGNDNIQHHGAGHLPQAAGYALTTLDNPVDVNGRRCAERLINQIVHQQHDIVHEYVPRQLVVRQTTGPAPS